MVWDDSRPGIGAGRIVPSGLRWPFRPTAVPPLYISGARERAEAFLQGLSGAVGP
jgi:hypothetical protein